MEIYKKYLGKHLHYNLCEAKEVTTKKSHLMQRVNTLQVTLGRSTDTIISKVFTSKCAHFHGTQAWNFNDNANEDYHRTCNRCVRRLFNLPYEIHYTSLSIQCSASWDLTFNIMPPFWIVSIEYMLMTKHARSISPRNSSGFSTRMSRIPYQKV